MTDVVKEQNGSLEIEETLEKLKVNSDSDTMKPAVADVIEAGGDTAKAEMQPEVSVTKIKNVEKQATEIKDAEKKATEVKDAEQPATEIKDTEKPAKKERPEPKKLLRQAVFLKDNFKIYIVDSPKAFDHVVKIFRQDVQEYGIISIDTESSVRPSKEFPYVPIELIQIGTLNGRAFLFRLDFIKPSEINYIRNILSDNNIMKIGSLFKNDARRLVNDWGIYVNNWFDIQTIARNCLDKRTLAGNQGLKNLTKALVGIELPQFDYEEHGDWSIEELSDGQINYAARDAMAIVDIFLNTYANRTKQTQISTEAIKQHIAWVKFCNTAFFS